MTCGPGSPGTPRPPWPRLAALRPRPGDAAGYATRVALRELGRRAEFLDGQLERLDELIVPLVTARAPACSACTASARTPRRCCSSRPGTIPERLRCEAAWAHLCGAAPIPASSGKVRRHRLNPGGDRQANHALWRIVFTRMELAPGHPRLRRAAHQRRPVQDGDHPLPEAVRRPRGLPPPAAPAADPQLPGAAWPANRLPQPCWPANDPSAAPGTLTCWAVG